MKARMSSSSSSRSSDETPAVTELASVVQGHIHTPTHTHTHTHNIPAKFPVFDRLVMLRGGARNFRPGGPKQPTGEIFIPHERAILLVFWCQRSRRNSNAVTPDGGAK